MKGELQPARSAIHGIAAELIRAAPPEEAAEIAWALACGAAVAERTRVIGTNNGILHVAAPDAEWRAQLVEFAPRYLAALAKLWPQGKIERIEVVQERKRG
jgi:predicted nucleic acid-binding Zn ribbon protein